MSSTPEPAAGGTPGRRARILTAVKWSAAALAVALLVVGVVRQWDAVARAVAGLSVGAVAIALAATAVALVANMASWRAMTTATGTRLPVTAASSVFFVGQLGKYLPGGVWSIAAQAELGRAYGLPRATSAVAALASMVVSMVTAALVGIVGLLVGAPDGLTTFWWLAIVAVVGLATLAPPVLTRLIVLAMRLLRRPPQVVALTWSGTLASVGWSTAMWLAYGLQATTILRAFGADGPTVPPLATGAYAVAWLVGFLVVVAPAGLGAREGVLVLLLGPVAGVPGALALAVVSRAMMTLGDVVLAAVGAALAVRHRRRGGRRSGRGGAAGSPERPW